MRAKLSITLRLSTLRFVVDFPDIIQAEFLSILRPKR